MGMTHYYPTTRCQSIVLSGLGLTAENYTEAEKLFESIGILVIATRQGRTSVPLITAAKYHGFASSDEAMERFNHDYAEIIRTNLSEYCKPEFLASITPVAKAASTVAQPVIAEQKAESTMTTLEDAMQERGMAEATYGSMDVIVEFDDNDNEYVAKYLYGGMPPHAYRQAPTLEQLLDENPELENLHWTAVSDEEI